MELIIAAVSLGILGSFHCIGMCGPIALALPIHHYSEPKKHIGVFLYNMGRITTYSFLGIIFGVLGQSFFLGGLQQTLSISIGIILLLSVILKNKKIVSHYKALGFIYSHINTIKFQLGNLFNKKGLRFLFFIGLLNGLLPCGLVYLGMAGAIATGHYLKGAAFMFYFGLGTAPVMYLVAFFGQFISLNYRHYIRVAMPFVVASMAILLIVRGLNLGIPYLSPQFSKDNHRVSCHDDKTINKHNIIECSPRNSHKK